MKGDIFLKSSGATNNSTLHYVTVSRSFVTTQLFTNIGSDSIPGCSVV